MTRHALLADPRADLDVEATVRWYEHQRPGLGLEFLEELRAAYTRIVTRPLGYQDVGLGTRRALLRRFPYAVYNVIGNDVIAVLAVLHASRDPAEWHRRREGNEPSSPS